MLSVFLRFTSYDYTSGIFKLFCLFHMTPNIMYLWYSLSQLSKAHLLFRTSPNRTMQDVIYSGSFAYMILLLPSFFSDVAPVWSQLHTNTGINRLEGISDITLHTYTQNKKANTLYLVSYLREKKIVIQDVFLSYITQNLPMNRNQYSGLQKSAVFTIRTLFIVIMS